jgi:hypothetical protein
MHTINGQSAYLGKKEKNELSHLWRWCSDGRATMDRKAKKKKKRRKEYASNAIHQSGK